MKTVMQIFEAIKIFYMLLFFCCNCEKPQLNANMCDKELHHSPLEGSLQTPDRWTYSELYK